MRALSCAGASEAAVAGEVVSRSKCSTTSRRNGLTTASKSSVASFERMLSSLLTVWLLRKNERWSRKTVDPPSSHVSCRLSSSCSVGSEPWYSRSSSSFSSLTTKRHCEYSRYVKRWPKSTTAQDVAATGSLPDLLAMVFSDLNDVSSACSSGSDRLLWLRRHKLMSSMV